ncbi:hypothetical protein Aduo_017149 [Ancylostoma duodenale]
MIRTSTVLLAVLAAARAELPKELDAFLEVLFDVKECDSFLSGEFTTVATVDCSPYKCDFPRQVCMRPNSKYQETSANECRAVPMECLVAANGGEPVGPPQVMTIQPPPITMPMVINKPRKEHGGGGFVGGGNKVQPMTINPMDICQMGPPDGRFCGFKVMYTYNKETLQCDEFWFPGCTTADTNANLFIDMQSCEKLAEMCRRSTPAPFTLPPPPPPPPPPTTTWAPLPPPPVLTPPPPPPPGLGMLGGRNRPHPMGGRGGGGGHGGGGGGGAAGGGGGGPFGTFPGLGSALGGPSPTITSPGSGDGEDLGLLGLIQQGIQNANAIRQGGPQGKQAAAAAAGQILQQFTGFDLNNLGGNFGSFFGR